jgi:hypothetical protein
MRSIYYAIVEGDPLSNGQGSRVVGGTPRSTIEGPDGKSRNQTHIGHKAWCSVCQSFGYITEGARIQRYLRGFDVQLNAYEAVNDDIVICKCQEHPRLVAQYGRLSSYIDDGRALPNSNIASMHASPEAPEYDERFAIHDANGSILADTYYTIESNGALTHGVTDSAGRTLRYKSGGAQNITIYLGHIKEA